MAAHSKWMVSELFDPRDPTIPRAVFAHRQGEKPWQAIQSHCEELPGKLAALYRMLSDAKLEPLVRPLLGRGCALTERTAHAVCRFRISEIGRMAGCAPGEIPSFLCHEGVNHGGRGHGRPCAVVKGDRVELFPSIADAARHLGRRRPTVSRAVGEGRRCGGGAVTL